MKVSNAKKQWINKQLLLSILSYTIILSIVACTQTNTAQDQISASQDDAAADIPSEIETADSGIETDSASDGSQSDTDKEAKNENIVTPSASPTETEETSENPDGFSQDLIRYETQSGDTLNAVAKHFDVLPGEIKSPDPIPDTGFMKPGQTLYIPDRLDDTSSNIKLMPDSEVVYSMSSANFNIGATIYEANGYLNKYSELLGSGWQSGSELVFTVASDFSINPRLLLSILEYQSHWVYQQPTTHEGAIYPMGYIDEDHAELYSQMGWVAQQLSIGYYGWRDGTLVSLDFPDGGHIRLAPDLNAGTVGLQYFFSRLYDQAEWEEILYEPDGFLMLYELMFADPWIYDQAMLEKYGPIIPGNLTQPEMELPFKVAHPWNLTGGPHPVWGSQGPWAALDFAPKGVIKCAASKEYVTAVAPGIIVRLGEGPVVEDVGVNADGLEQSGWSFLYMHISFHDRIAEGTYVEANDLIGHPSCYGGRSTGTHVHIGRKYNGEWIKADGPVPFNLSGWQAKTGVAAYSGQLIKGDLIVQASDFSGFESLIIRE